MSQQLIHQQAMMSGQGPPPSQMQMHQPTANQMAIPQQPPPGYMPQSQPNQIQKMHHPQQIQQMHGHHGMVPITSNPPAMIHQQHQQQMNMGQPMASGNPRMERAPTATGRGGRRKSAASQEASAGNQRGQKRKKDSKASFFQPPEYTGNPMSQMQHHPSTAQFPHAPPSTHQQYAAMQHHVQQQQMWNMNQQMNTQQQMAAQQQMATQQQMNVPQNQLQMQARVGAPNQQKMVSGAGNKMQGHEGKLKLHDKLMEKMSRQ